MAAAYEHSETFASLKVIREEVSENLTTMQWLTPLDFFIESAIDPITTVSPDLVDNYLAKVVAWQSHKPSIKFSMGDKFTLPVKLFNSLTTEGPQRRGFQKSMSLNRGLLFGLIAIFEQTLNSVKRLHSPALVIPRHRRLHLLGLACDRIGIHPSVRPHLFGAMSHVQHFAGKAYWFKELILQKYVRLALMSAKKTYVDVRHAVKLNDVVQVYLNFLSRAIDRCDSRQGVLTTFIQTWFYSARAEVHKMAAGSAHLSYEELIENGLPIVTSDPDLGFEQIQHLAYTAKKVDPHGVVRFSLRIPEFLSWAELNTLKIFTTPKGNSHD